MDSLRRSVVWLLPLVLAAPTFADACGDVSKRAPYESRQRAHEDWLLLCVLEAPRLEFDPITAENLNAVANSITETCAEVLSNTLSRQQPAAADGLFRQLAKSALRIASEGHRAWLTTCLRDFAAIETGMCRGDVPDALLTEGGIQVARHTAYHHCSCLYLKAEIRFVSAIDEGTPSGGPEDLVEAVEGLVFDLYRTD